MGKAAKKQSMPAAGEDKKAAQPSQQQEGNSLNRFQNYLQSEDGMNSMKMFVISNSIIMVLTLGWPAMKIAYEMVMSFMDDP